MTDDQFLAWGIDYVDSPKDRFAIRIADTSKAMWQRVLLTQLGTPWLLAMKG